MTLQHLPSIPPGFEKQNPKILIVGHSHHKRQEDDDYAEFTIDCVMAARDGRMQTFPFFARQPNYMRLSREQYFDSVSIINYIPAALHHRYAKPSQKLVEQGKTRFLRVLGEMKPSHVFVLTSRSRFGVELPHTIEQQRQLSHTNIKTDFGEVPIATYFYEGGACVCCQLRHPQAAKTAMMQQAFDAVLARKPLIG